MDPRQEVIDTATKFIGYISPIQFNLFSKNSTALKRISDLSCHVSALRTYVQSDCPKLAIEEAGKIKDLRRSLTSLKLITEGEKQGINEHINNLFEVFKKYLIHIIELAKANNS